MTTAAETEALAVLAWCGGTVPRAAAELVLCQVGAGATTTQLAVLDGVLIDDELIVLTGPALQTGSQRLLDHSDAWRERCLRSLLPAVDTIIHSDTADAVRLAAAVCGIRAFELLGVTPADARLLGSWALVAAELLRQDGQHEAAEAVILEATAVLQAGS